MIPADCDLEAETLAVPAAPGVCLLTGKGDVPVLLLIGANLRLVVRRRLTEEDESQKSRRTRLRPIVEKIWCRRCYSRFETQLNYFKIARQVYPDSWREFFPRLSVWFVHIDPQADYPVFSKVNDYDPTRGLYWGPFADGRAVDRLLEILTKIFKLCRNDNILKQAPTARACSYAEMNLCETVCNGAVSQEAYRNIVEQAIEFLNLKPAVALERMSEEVKELSGKLEFERAKIVHQRLETCRELLGKAYRWYGPMTEFSVLTFQPGPKIKVQGKRKLQPLAIPMVIGPGWVCQIEPFELSNAQAACDKLLDHLNLTQFQADGSQMSVDRAQILAWTTHLLYNSSKDKGLFVRSNSIDNAKELSQQVEEHFSRAVKKNDDKPQLDAYNLS